MEDPRIDRHLLAADAALSRGDDEAAIESLKGALSADPELALAHALLSLCLLNRKRLGAAELEAGLALASEPGLTLGHRAMGHVLMARRKFGEAEPHLRRALEVEPEEPEHYRSLATLHRLTDAPGQALRLLNKALELDPEDPDILADLGQMRLAEGRTAEAETLARQGLASEPEHVRSVVLMGQVALRRGELEAARAHAAWALQLDASDEDALRLMASLKARTSWLIGAWWRFSVWMGELGTGRTITVLLGAYLAVQVLRRVLLDLGQASASEVVTYLWLAVCVYTWVGPGLFQRKVKEELAAVRLKRDF